MSLARTNAAHHHPATLLSRDRLLGLFCSRSVFAPLFAQHEVCVLVDAVERGRRTVARAAVPSRQRRLARTPRAEREGATMRDAAGAHAAVARGPPVRKRTLPLAL